MLALVVGASPARAQDGRSAAPRTILARAENLEAARKRIRSGDAALRAAYDALIDSAKSAMAMKPLSVMQKGKTPPSGNKHDYLSLAPYWWPDPSKPNGLPYIRRDGEMNPESRVDHDGLRLQRTVDAAHTLALAAYFSGERKYAERAAMLLRIFFVDTATRMNPNLNYAQAVLGVNEGRGTGIVDTRDLAWLVDAIRLLESMDALPTKDDDALVAWCRSYLDWLFTSKNGKEEQAAENNHGTWYDAQAEALAIFVGDSARSRELLDEAKKRIAKQIAPDGRQPLELERTRPIHYTLFNLDAFTQLAEMARHLGVDLWRYKAPTSGGIVDALRFVAPYADLAKKWEKPEVMPLEPDDFLVPLRRGAAATGDAALKAGVEKIPAELARIHRSRLLYPDAP